jgi:glycosyltransferase involved in cell wall biosynthesis
MRLLFIAPSAYMLGGVQDWLYSTVIGLRKRGHEVCVGIPFNHFHNGKRYNEKYKGLDAKFFVNRSGTDEGRTRSLKNFLSKSDADIVIGVNIGNIFEAIARERSNKNRRFVITIHAIEANYFADLKEYKDIIDGVIVTNRLTEKMVVKVGGIEKERVLYAPYGVAIRKSGKIQERESSLIRIAWVGRIQEKQKRVFDLVRVVKALDIIGINYKLSIAGGGPDKDLLAVALDQWVKSNKVSFYGMVQKTELDLFYRENDILLITSEWETGPIVAWEAVDAGLAIVSSNYVGLKSEGTLKDEETALLFDVGDCSSAAQKIAMLRNRELASRLRLNAKRIVGNKYSIEASLDAWEKAFEKIKAFEKRPDDQKTTWAIKMKPAGRLERILGCRCAEIVRSIFQRSKAMDAGSEWPHSLQGISDQSWTIEDAKQIEKVF